MIVYWLGAVQTMGNASNKGDGVAKCDNPILSVYRMFKGVTWCQEFMHLAYVTFIQTLNNSIILYAYVGIFSLSA